MLLCLVVHVSYIANSVRLIWSTSEPVFGNFVVAAIYRTGTTAEKKSQNRSLFFPVYPTVHLLISLSPGTIASFLPCTPLIRKKSQTERTTNNNYTNNDIGDRRNIARRLFHKIFFVFIPSIFFKISFSIRMPRAAYSALSLSVLSPFSMNDEAFLICGFLPVAFVCHHHRLLDKTSPLLYTCTLIITVDLATYWPASGKRFNLVTIKSTKIDSMKPQYTY